jgi:hypothetical protein
VGTESYGVNDCSGVGSVRQLRCLDPCMGSGHFVVAMFERLVALRLAEEVTDELGLVAAVISENSRTRCRQAGGHVAHAGIGPSAVERPT